MDRIGITGSVSVAGCTYDILSLPIYRGGTSLLYRARIRGSAFKQTVVLIKEFFPVGCHRDSSGKVVLGAREKTIKKYFFASQRLVAKLNTHQVCSSFVGDEELGLVVLLHAGEDLKTLGETLSLLDSMPDPQRVVFAVDILESILKGLQQLHAKGIVHCDLSPGNVLLSEREAFLIDLCSATRMGRKPKAGFTPAFAAPELVDGQAVTVATDIFSAGALFSTLLFGNSVILGGRIEPRSISPLLSSLQIAASARRALGIVLDNMLRLSRHSYLSCGDIFPDLVDIRNATIHDEKEPPAVKFCSYSDLKDLFQPREIAEQLLENDRRLYPELLLAPHNPTNENLMNLIKQTPENFGFLCDTTTNRIVGNWSCFFLNQSDTDRVRSGDFLEETLSATARSDALFSSELCIYLGNLSVNDSHRNESARELLWKTFAGRLCDLAVKGVFVSSVYTTLLLPEHIPVFEEKGFQFLCKCSAGGNVFQLDLSRKVPDGFAAILPDRDLEDIYLRFWTDRITFRQLSYKDYLSGNLDFQQLTDAASLIYETDPFIYPAMFYNQETGVRIIANLLASNEDRMFTLDHLFVAIAQNRIIGIVLHKKGPLLWDPQATYRAAALLRLPLGRVALVEKEYFSAYDTTKPDTTAILNVCVDHKFRLKGLRIGQKMLASYLAEHPEPQELFVLEQTPVAYRVYQRLGFKTVSLCNGFSEENLNLPCFFMRRPSQM